VQSSSRPQGPGLPGRATANHTALCDSLAADQQQGPARLLRAITTRAPSPSAKRQRGAITYGKADGSLTGFTNGSTSSNRVRRFLQSSALGSFGLQKQCSGSEIRAGAHGGR